MLEALRSDIVPRLLIDVPGQPTAEALEADRHKSRFVLLFDREGYSPAFFKEMWNEHRIACITYNKFPKGNWPESCFEEVHTTMPNGEKVSMKLAEMGSWVGTPRKNGLWMREVRKLCEGGHQTSLLSTAYSQRGLEDATSLFSRWTQENFFGYMMQHYAFDKLSEYGTDPIPGTNKPVVNPAWRVFERQRRSIRSRLDNRLARFAAMDLHPETTEKKIPKWELRKGELLEEIQSLEHLYQQVKDQLKETPGHLDWADLPDSEKCERLAPSRKQLMDTVKFVAYRAETAMVNLLPEKNARADDARAHIRDLFQAHADIRLDCQANRLYVRIHTRANNRFNKATALLLEKLNETESRFPGTHLQLVYTLAGFPASQISAGTTESDLT